MKVIVVLATGFEEVEAVTIIDVLRRGQIEVVVATVNDILETEGAHAIEVVADAFLKQISIHPEDMIVLPGGMPGSRNLALDQHLSQILVEHHGKGGKIGAICAAPSVLGGLGLLKGLKATCYPGFESELIGASVMQSSVVLDENILTGKGMGVAIQFSLEILKMYKNASEVAIMRDSFMMDL